MPKKGALVLPGLKARGVFIFFRQFVGKEGEEKT